MAIWAETFRYIKLGKGGRWDDVALDRGEPHLGYRKSPHEVPLAGNFDALKQHLIGFGKDAQVPFRCIFRCIFLTAFFLNGTVAAVAQSPGDESRGSALSLVPRGSEQPSFDCEKAKAAVARLICADGELARLDGELGDVFRRRKVFTQAADRSKFVASQIAWIRKRNENCALKGKDAAAVEALADLKPCVARALRERIDFLNQGDRANIPIASALPLLQTVRGRCSQNYCMWMRLTAQTVVGTDASGGRLVRSMIESAETGYVDENQPPPKTMSWGKPFESYAFCSRTKPAIINKWRGWSAVLLAPGYPGEVSGSIEGSLIEYFLVCHGLTNVDIRDPSLAVRYSYPADIVKRASTVALVAPGDIMDPEARDGAIFVQILCHGNPKESPGYYGHNKFAGWGKADGTSRR